MESVGKKTRTAFIWTQLLNAPFWALYGLLVFILYKDLHATPLQVATFLTLKPVVSVLSVYWSQLIDKRQDRLLSNIIIGGLLGHLPFFFFPFYSDPWFIILSGAFYMMLTRGIVPAWMEILKINLSPTERQKVFSAGSMLSYLGAVLFPFLIGDFLDTQPGIWKWFFPAAALLSLGSLFFQLRVPIAQNHRKIEAASFTGTSPILRFLSFFALYRYPIEPKIAEKTSSILTFSLSKPWTDVWKLFQGRRDFYHFQVGFFFGGAGLMLMQPALPEFFFQILDISYTELAFALSLCKGIGFVLTSRAWASLMSKINIFRFSSFVTILAMLFPFCLLLAESAHAWLYASYLLYGIMQAGSELSWHLSGPTFAKNEDSSLFSSVNVATVGLRGCIAPFLGSFLCSAWSPTGVLILGGLLCGVATLQMSYHGSKRNQAWQK